MVFGSFGMKLLKGAFFYCNGLPPDIEVKTNLECMDFGGAWVNSSLGFDNIIDSICCCDNGVLDSTSNETIYNLLVSLSLECSRRR